MKYWSEEEGYFGIEEGMVIKSRRGVDTEVFFTAEHWDKAKPLLSKDNDSDFQYLQVRDQNGDAWWISSYPSWVVVE